MKPKTYREARRVINQMEAWFREHEGRFSPADRVVFRTLFEDAYSPAQAVTLAAHLHALVLPEDQPTRTHTINGANPNP